jgi:hypothetical protein
MPDAPLAKSVRLLLSPSAEEQKAFDTVERKAPPATYARVKKAIDGWRNDCFDDPAGVAILYAAGHGVWRNPVQAGTLLLQDFAADPARIMESALDIPTVHYAMGAAGGPQRQFYFLDACRNHVDVPGALLADPGLPGWTGSIRNYAKTAPIFFSAAAGTTAYGIPGEATVFSQALLEALTRAGIDLDEDGEWVVRDSTLGPPIIRQVAELAEARGTEQAAATGGTSSGVPFHICRAPPDVPITLSVAPPEAEPAARCTMRLDQRDVLTKSKVPVKETVPAGNYLLRVTINPPDQRFSDVDEAWLVHPAHSTERKIEVAA